MDFPAASFGSSYGCVWRPCGTLCASRAGGAAAKPSGGKSFTIEALLGGAGAGGEGRGPQPVASAAAAAAAAPPRGQGCPAMPHYLYMGSLSHPQPACPAYCAPFSYAPFRLPCYAPEGPPKSALQSCKHRAGKSKRMRTSFTNEQLSRLEKEFSRQQYMVGSERFVLASSLQLTEAQVKVWFQNRRIKFRKQSLDQQHAKLAKLGVGDAQGGEEREAREARKAREDEYHTSSAESDGDTERSGQ